MGFRCRLSLAAQVLIDGQGIWRESDQRCLLTDSGVSETLYKRLSGVTQCPKEAFLDVVHYWMAVYVCDAFICFCLNLEVRFNRIMAAS